MVAQKWPSDDNRAKACYCVLLPLLAQVRSAQLKKRNIGTDMMGKDNKITSQYRIRPRSDDQSSCMTTARDILVVCTDLKLDTSERILYEDMCEQSCPSVAGTIVPPASASISVFSIPSTKHMALETTAPLLAEKREEGCQC